VNRAIAPLLLVLLVQCLLVALLYRPGVATDRQQPVETLTDTAPRQVDEIHIGDEYDNEAVLRRVGARWSLPELGGLPADSSRVEQMLQGILPADPGWPVADSPAARQRFQVADYYYQRRISLLREGELLETLYLGTAPAFRRVHARSEAGSAIYSLSFNAFDAPAVDDAWLDRSLLQVRSPLEVVADAYSVHWRDGHWVAGGGGQPDQRELDALLSALRSLQVRGVAAQDVQRELSQAEADLLLNVTGLRGEVTLELFQFEGAHYIYSSRHDFLFRLSDYDYDRLTGIDFMLISGDRAGAGDEPGRSG
jgi:hypothetical protein